MRRGLTAVLKCSAALCSPACLWGPAWAQEAALALQQDASAAPSPRRLEAVRVPLEAPLELNGKFLGSISVEVDTAGEGAIDAPRLLELLRPALSPELVGEIESRVAGREKVEMADLAVDGFEIAFDPALLTVRASVAAANVAETQLSLVAREQPPDPAAYEAPEDFALGLNISLGQQFVHDGGAGFEPLRGALAGFANLGGFGGVTLTGGADYQGGDGSDNWLRREFRLTRDFYHSALRATAGEFTPLSFGFQGSGRVLGLGLERAYSTIRPFQNVRPVGRQTFTLERESTVEVFVNDIRTETLVLPAGRYDISDFPFAGGPNEIRLVVEDLTGRREIASFDIFSDTALLNPGITEFGAAIGLREGRSNLVYDGGPIGTAYALRGVTDTLTLGAHGQASELAVQGGVIAAWGTPVGFVQVEGALSRNSDTEETGSAISLDYRGEFSLLDENDMRVTMSGLYSSRHFQDAFVPFARNPQEWQFAVRAQWRSPYRVAFGAGYSYSKGRDSVADIERFDLSVGRSFGPISLTGTASRVVNGEVEDWRVGLGLSVRFGPRWHGSARYDSRRDLKELEISRSPTGRLGDLSGDLRIGEDQDSFGIAGRGAFVHNRFDLVVRHDYSAARSPLGASFAQTSWSLNTFAGYADGQVAIGRQSQEGFLIATRHESLEDSQLEVKSGERTIARSGAFGPALVPVSRAYGVQRLEMLVDPLPVAYDLGSGSVSIFPGYGSGYAVQVGSDASRIAVGFMTSGGEPVVLVGGTVELIEGESAIEPRPFFTNRSGRFVADGLAPGHYRIVIGGEARAEFEVPEEQEGMVDVGTIEIGAE